MPQILRHVQPRLEPIPQAFDPFVVQWVHRTLPFFLRFRTRPWLPAGITQIEATNLETLVDLYRQFQAGQIRFMLAFRHVEVDDPLCGLYLLSRLVPRTARQQGIPLHYPLHTHFLFDRGMPLWGGEGLGWLLSRLGGIAIHRGKHPDWQALRTARDLMMYGTLPMAVAPEGATNGHSEIVSPAEPGTAQLSFWCVEDLHKAGRSETVWVVPIGLQYRYIHPAWDKLDRLMAQLEATAGVSVQSLNPSTDTEREQVYYQRLLRLGEHLLTKMEQFYTRFYHRSLPPKSTSEDTGLSENQALRARLQILLDQALQVAEDYFGVSSQGTLNERCRRVEEAGWTYIYRQDIPDPSQLSRLDRGLADWIAEEASLRLLHMRLVESFVAVTGTYVAERPTFERFAETTLLLFDLMARVRGDKYPQRPRLGHRHAQFTVGQPISVSDRWPLYQSNRQAARRAIATLTQDLQDALEKMIA